MLLTMAYTIRLIVKVRDSRRIIKPFLRPEHATNTSSHATRFDTVEAADVAADIAAEHFRAAGHTVIGSDTFEV